MGTQRQTSGSLTPVSEDEPNITLHYFNKELIIYPYPWHLKEKSFGILKTLKTWFSQLTRGPSGFWFGILGRVLK